MSEPTFSAEARSAGSVWWGCGLIAQILPASSSVRWKSIAAIGPPGLGIGAPPGPVKRTV